MIHQPIRLVILVGALSGCLLGSEHEAMEAWKAEQRHDLDRAYQAALPNDPGTPAAAGMAAYYRQAAAEAQAEADARAADENAREAQRQAAYAEQARRDYAAAEAWGFARADRAWRDYARLVQQARADGDPRRELLALSLVPDDRQLGIEPVHLTNSREHISDEEIIRQRRRAFGELLGKARDPGLPIGQRILYHQAVIAWIGQSWYGADLDRDRVGDQGPSRVDQALWWSLRQLGQFGDPQAAALCRLLDPVRIGEETTGQPLQDAVLALARLRPLATGLPSAPFLMQVGLTSEAATRLVIAQTALVRLAEAPQTPPVLDGSSAEAAAQAAAGSVKSVGHFLAAEFLRTADPAQAKAHWRATLTEGEPPLRVAAAFELAWSDLLAGDAAGAGRILVGLPPELPLAAPMIALGRSLMDGTALPGPDLTPASPPQRNVLQDPVPLATYLSRRALAAITAPGLPPSARRAAAHILWTGLGAILQDSGQVFSSDRIQADANLRLQIALEQGWLDLNEAQGDGVWWRWHRTNNLIKLARGGAAAASPAERAWLIDRLRAGRCATLIEIQNYSEVVPFTAVQQRNLGDALAGNPAVR